MRRIASTSRAALRVRGVQGQQLLDLHQQLARMIQTRIGDAGAAWFLAEPVINTKRDEIDWYTRAEGPVRGLATLGEAQRRELLDSAGETVERIRAIADDLRATGQMQRIADADLLMAAMVDPRPEDLYLVGEQLVLINWGADLVGIARARRGKSARGGAGEETEDDQSIGIRRAIPVPPPPRRPVRLGPLLTWPLATPIAAAAVVYLMHNVLLPPGDGMAAALREKRGALQVAIGDAKANIDFKRVTTCQARADKKPIGWADNETERRFHKTQGTIKGLLVVLAWNTRDDVDLEVTDANGQTISSGQPTSKDGGRLVASMNHGTDKTTEPIEIVQWEDPAKLKGPLTVKAKVRKYDPEEGPPRPLFLALETYIDGRGHTTFYKVLEKDAKNGEHVFDPISLPSKK